MCKGFGYTMKEGRKGKEIGKGKKVNVKVIQLLIQAGASLTTIQYN